MKTSLFQLYEYITNKICTALFVKGFVVVLWKKKKKTKQTTTMPKQKTTTVQSSMSGPENTELQQT